ncbi:hypothetical protein REPUB_Repub12eG0010200 [Reevesia pubescens]
MDPDVVAKAFFEHYYSTFDAIQAGLANLYQGGSMLTFEGQKIQGSQNFVAKFTGLLFQQCQHNITIVDCQPSGAGGILVFIFGTFQLAGEQHALKFSKVTPLSLHLSLVSFWFLGFCGFISRLRFGIDGFSRYLHGNKLTGASKIYAEQREEEVKILEHSVEELECTINVLEKKVRNLKFSSIQMFTDISELTEFRYCKKG